MGRPRKSLDPLKVIDLSSQGMVQEEIAAFLNVSVDTLTRRCAEEIKKGHRLRNASLRRKQFERANAGSDTMLIWLGKQHLGQSDKSEFTGKIEHEHSDLSELSNEQLEKVRKLIESVET